MPKSRSKIKIGVKYDDKDQHEICTLSQRRLVADAYWTSLKTGGRVNLWTWFIKDNGQFTIENFKKVACEDVDQECVDQNDKPLYPTISRIQPEPLFDIIWNSSNPAWVPRQPTNKPKSKLDVLKVQEFLRPWFYDINYVIEDPEYPGFVSIGTRYIAESCEQVHGAFTIYLCGVCCNEMSLSDEDVKKHLSTKHDCEAFVPISESAEKLSKPKKGKRKYERKPFVPLEIYPSEPVEKIRHIVKRNSGPNRRYMDKVSKKRIKPAIPKQTMNERSEMGPAVEIPVANFSDDTRELEEVIGDCEREILLNEAQKEKQSWKERLEVQNESWEKMRPIIGEQIGQSRMTPKDEIVHCNTCQDRAVLHCVTCSQYFCKVCDSNAHIRNPFHKREHWLNGAFQPLTCLETVENDRIGECCSFLPMATSNMLCHNCDTRGKWKRSMEEEQKMIVVTLQGRFDVQLEVLLCDNCALQRKYSFMDFYNSGYFPGSVRRFLAIYALDLLELCTAVQYNSPGLTLNSFVKSLEGMKNHGGNTINQSAFAKALEEFGFLQHDLAKLRGEDGFICPSCTPDTHSIMVDGNMKLKRLSSVSRGERKSYFGSELFIPDEEVDQHVILQRSAVKTPNSEVDVCGQSHWKAAKESSHRMARLDQTGVFGSTCRHVIPRKLLNMFQGEIFAYAHCMHSYFVNNSKFQYLWYDIICQYWKYCERMDSGPNAKDILTAAVEPALPLMHAKGHSSTCQIMWGGDWKNGAGTTSGEETEQFWSYLSNACKPTKYMGCARREEVITRLASFWGRKKVKSLPEYLSRRYRKVRKMVAEAEEELAKYKEYDLIEMKQDILDHVKDSTNRNGVSPEVEYFQLRKQEDVFNALNNGQPDPISRIVTGTVDLHLSLEKKRAQRLKRLEQLEKDHGQSIEQAQKSTALDLLETKRNEIELHVHTYNTREEKFLSLAETSKERHKLRRANQKTRKTIEKAVEIYNIAAQDTENEVQINSTEMGCILKADFPWRSDITLGKKRDLVNKKESFERLKEEEVLLKKEMKQFLLYYKSKDTNGNVGMEMDVNNINDATYMKGLVCSPFFNDEARTFAKVQIERGIQHFKNIDETIVDNTSESDDDSELSDLSDIESDQE